MKEFKINEAAFKPDTCNHFFILTKSYSKSSTSKAKLTGGFRSRSSHSDFEATSKSKQPFWLRSHFEATSKPEWLLRLRISSLGQPWQETLASKWLRSHFEARVADSKVLVRLN